MLNVEVKLLTVDWEMVLDALLPTVMERAKAMENSSIPIRMLNKLDETSAAAFHTVLRTLPSETRDELICVLLNMYHEKIITMLNNAMKRGEEDGFVTLGDLRVYIQDQRLVLNLTDINVDYAQKVGKRQLVQAAARIFHSAIDTVVHYGAEWALENHPDLIMNRVRAMLEKQGLQGIEMKLAMIADASQIADGQPPATKLSEEAQDKLLDVLVGFIAQIAQSAQEEQV